MNISKRIGGTLNQWYYQSPIVNGVINGDDYWEDGLSIHTSRVVGVNLEKGILETQNTFYKLGTPNKYLKGEPFPDFTDAPST